MNPDFGNQGQKKTWVLNQARSSQGLSGLTLVKMILRAGKDTATGVLAIFQVEYCAQILFST